MTRQPRHRIDDGDVRPRLIEHWRLEPEPIEHFDAPPQLLSADTVVVPVPEETEGP